MPLLEPLEYKEVWRLDALAIAIDTSGSCDAALVSRFLKETYGIFSSRENFFQKMKVVFPMRLLFAGYGHHHQPGTVGSLCGLPENQGAWRNGFYAGVPGNPAPSSVRNHTQAPGPALLYGRRRDLSPQAGLRDGICIGGPKTPPGIGAEMGQNAGIGVRECIFSRQKRKSAMH